MGVEALRAVIEAEGRTRVAAVLRDAEEQAAGLRAEAESTGARRREETLRREEAALRRAGGARVAAARPTARRRVLEARDDLIERVFAMAREAPARETDSTEARGWLDARVEEALSHMPGSNVVIRAASDVFPILQGTLAERPGVRVECDPELAAGFRAVRADGSLLVDATTESLLELHRPRLAIELLARLERETGS